MTKLEKAIAAAKAEILSDVRECFVPTNVESFSDLHDHVDANEYGGLTADNFVSEFASHEEWIAFGNELQDAIDAWLKEGGINAALDAERETKATQNMVADMERDGLL